MFLRLNESTPDTINHSSNIKAENYLVHQKEFKKKRRKNFFFTKLELLEKVMNARKLKQKLTCFFFQKPSTFEFRKK